MRVIDIGIAFSMSGDDYSFCYKCLKAMTANLFWKKMFEEKGYVYPVKVVGKNA
jgi:hypothetical protein